MQRITARVLSLVLVVGLMNPVSAFSEASPFVAVVDMQRLVSGSVAGKAVQSDLQSDARKREALLGVRKGELDRLKEELGKQAGVLSAAALEEKQASFERKARDFERDVRDQREELERKRGAAMEKLVAQVDRVIKEVAAQRNLSFVVEKDARLVIYSDARLDITDEVLRQLDSASVGM